MAITDDFGSQVLKVYLIEKKNSLGDLNLERVFCVDNSERELREAPVQRLPGSDVDPQEQLLRIT